MLTFPTNNINVKLFSYLANMSWLRIYFIKRKTDTRPQIFWKGVK